MLVSALIEELSDRMVTDVVVVGPDTAVTTVTHDSRTSTAGSLFACLRGASFDGHDHAGRAITGGATALLVDHPLVGVEGIDTVAQLVVDDTRIALGPIAATVHGNPSDSLVTVGITGTNGKTTTAQLVASILREHGWATQVIGTLHGTRTTPEAPELQSLLASFVTDGAGAAVLEVSSHALALHRVDGTIFDVVVFTNLGRDHLDLHGSTEEYFRAKARLFDRTFAPLAVLNVDDLHGQLLFDTLNSSDHSAGEPLRTVAVSIDELTNIEVTAGSHSYEWRGWQVRVPLGGHFNVSNSLCALTVAVELGVDPSVAVAALAAAEAIPGRFESIDEASALGFTVIVDYAHTPDGLAEVLSSARSVAEKGSSVIVVFGAGGERDHDKREQMGAAAAAGADVVVVTSDNPRREDPMSIIGDILGGVSNAVTDVEVEPDRKAAIDSALRRARLGDVVVIAGKGHEQTQDLGEQVIEFDDRAVVRELLGTHR